METAEEIQDIENCIDDALATVTGMFPDVEETWIRMRLYAEPMNALIEFILMNMADNEIVPKNNAMDLTGDDEYEDAITALSISDREEEEEAVTAISLPAAVNESFSTALRITCGICYEDFDVRNAISCRSVQDHVFCEDCASAQVRACAESGRVAVAGLGIPCLLDCDSYIPRVDILSIADETTLRRLDALLDSEAMRASGIEVENCKSCQYQQMFDVSKDENARFACIECGAEFCRKCYKDWPPHVGRTCDQLVTEAEQARKRLEDQLTNAVVRTCPDCKLQFQKEDGCNLMTCRCGTKQCYNCGAHRITYEHFCNHSRIPTINACTANGCKKVCLLWNDVANVMQTRRNAVLNQAANVLELDNETIRGLQ